MEARNAPFLNENSKTPKKTSRREPVESTLRISPSSPRVSPLKEKEQLKKRVLNIIEWSPISEKLRLLRKFLKKNSFEYEIKK